MMTAVSPRGDAGYRYPDFVATMGIRAAFQRTLISATQSWLGAVAVKLAVHQVRRRSSIAIADGRFEAFASACTVNIAFFHQTGNTLITDVNACVDEIG